MKKLLKKLKGMLTRLISRGKRAEQKKAGEKWDSIVEELRNKNYKGNTSTKVLIDINNQSMISLQIQQLSNCGIKKFVVITNPAFDELIRNDLKI